jgi:hypothetical protein
VCNRSLDTYFAGGKGVTADFVLKSGELQCFASIQPVVDIGCSAEGKGHSDGEAAQGTYMKVVFDRPLKMS